MSSLKRKLIGIGQRRSDLRDVLGHTIEGLQKRAGRDDQRDRVLWEAYFHIHNGGMFLSLRDYGYGPTLRVEYSHFSVFDGYEDFHLTREAMVDLARMCLKATGEQVQENERPATFSPSERVSSSVVFGDYFVRLVNDRGDRLEIGFDHEPRFGLKIRSDSSRWFLETNRESFFCIAGRLIASLNDTYSQPAEDAFYPDPDENRVRLYDSDLKDALRVVRKSSPPTGDIDDLLA